MAPANLGDLVPLGQALMNFTWYGYVTDIDTPTGVWATMEAVGDEAFVTMDVLQGPRGFPGQNAPLVEVPLVDAAGGLWPLVGDCVAVVGGRRINRPEVGAVAVIGSRTSPRRTC